ncbi:hypothetical protein THIOKS1570026 [Thiocapsa sp. KS1]|nr:hypothetical protein THIOKS1570026 [Thiocapsa sp. KS1]
MNRQTTYETGALPRSPAGSDTSPTSTETGSPRPHRATEHTSESPLVWRDEWCMGIPTLDADHRKLVKLVNILLTGQPAGQPEPDREDDHHRSVDLTRAEPLRRFEALVDHLRHHFEREEALMLSIDYDDFQTHKCEHSLQLAELTELRRQLLSEGRAHFSRESLQWIKRWCFDHFIAEDRRLADAYANTTRP